MSEFVNRFKQAFDILLDRQQPDLVGGVIRFGEGAAFLYDGVNYTQPIPLPRRIQEQSARDIETYLSETIRSYNPEWSKSPFGSPYNTDKMAMMLRTSDPLSEWDFETRVDVLEQTHLAAERNPIAKAAVNYTRLFAVGQGATISYSNDAVEEACERFLTDDDNNWTEMEGQLCEALYEDGEVFIRFHQGQASQDESESDVVITALKPWGVYAIYHEPGFFRRPTEYIYRVSESDGRDGMTAVDEPIPAADVLHFAINRLPYEQRGKPELFAALPYLKAYKQLLEDKARDIHYNPLVYDVKAMNASASQIATRLGQVQQPFAGPGVNYHTDKEEWTLLTRGATAGQDADWARQVKIEIATSLGLAEYMLADGENANLASATAQQLPAIKTFEDWQGIMGNVVRGILRKYVSRLVEAGELPEEVEEMDGNGDVVMEGPEDSQTPSMIKAVDAFDVQYQKLESSDPKNIMEAITLARQGEEPLMSRATAISKTPFGLDPVVEQRKMEQEYEEDLQKTKDRMTQGLLPFPMGGMTPFPPGNGNGQGPQPEPNVA